MKWINFLLILSLLAFVSCSNNKKSAQGTEGSGELVEQDADFIVDSEDEDLMLEEDSASEPGEELAVGEESPSTPVSIDSGSNGQYTVKKGDTLMWIAFKIYGDYSKWKEISEANGGVSDISVGQVLSYNEPVEKFVWQPNGLPHTVVENETLGTISNDKYGTPSKWKSIFDNNQPMIKDPNLIFAGFTLYYIPDREIASE